MATSQGISPLRVSQDARFVPQQASPKAEVAEMLRAALALARLPWSLVQRCAFSSRKPETRRARRLVDEQAPSRLSQRDEGQARGSSGPRQQGAHSRSWVVKTSALAAPDAGFKKCCLKSGRLDGSQRNYYRRD